MKKKKYYVVILFVCLGILGYLLFVYKGDSSVENKKNSNELLSRKVDELKIDQPTGREILGDLKVHSSNNKHPRLLATNEDFQRIKESIPGDKVLKSWYDKLRGNANEILEKPAVEYVKTDDVRLLSVSRTVQDRIITLSLMYRLSGDKKYAERAWKELETVSNKQKFQDWNPSHFLDTAEMAVAVAIGYDWLYDFLNTEQKSYLQNAIMGKALYPALKVYENNVTDEGFTTFWTDNTNNWNIVSNSGLILSALAIADQSPESEELSTEILEHALKSIRNSLDTYIGGNGSQEGPSYWNYATLYIAYFLSAMNTSLGTDYGFSGYKGLSETGYYPIYITGNAGIFNLGDAGKSNFTSLPQLLWFAEKYKEPELKYFALDKYSPLNIIWYGSSMNSQEIEEKLPLDKYFKEEETGIVTMRGSWNNSNSIFVGIHAGDNQAAHGDLDIGTFVLDALGVRWSIDLGADDYNLPGYFEGNRWNYYRKRAEGQNTLVINPSQGPDQNTNAIGKITNFKTGDREASVSIDMTTAYINANKVQRKLSLFDNRTKVVLNDEINLEKQSEVYWFMHTYASIGLSSDKRVAVLVQDGKILYVRIASPKNATFSIMEAKSLSSSSLIDKQDTNANIKKLTIHMTDIKETKLSVEFSTEPFEN